MCEVIDHRSFRAFQDARDNGKRIGLTQQEAVHRVCDAMREGLPATVASGQILHEAIRSKPLRPRFPGGDAA